MVKPLLLGFCAALAAAGCAVTSDSRVAAEAPSATANVNCVTSTGSRIHRNDTACLASPGRTYSKADLDRTGAVTVSEALRRLDPSITGGR